MSTLHEVLELTFKPRRPAWDVPGVAGEQPWWSRYAEVLLADVRRLEPNGNMEGVYHEKVRWTNNLHPLGMLKWLNPATWDVLTWLFLKCFLVSIHLLKCRILVPEKCGTVAHCYILLYQLCITWPHSFERGRHDDIRVLRGYQAASRAMLWFDAAIFLADAECAKPLTAWGCYAQVNDPGLQVRDDNCFKKLLAKWRSIQCTFLPILLRISCKLLFSRRLWCRLNRFWLSI